MEETVQAKRARLEKEIADLKSRFPEHCSGTHDYVDVHRARPELWQKIEDLEAELKRLKR